MNVVDRILKSLRSPRIAAVSIAACVVWLGVAAALPSLGPRPFASWPFAVLVAWVAASTAVCAWDRTASAARSARSRSERWSHRLGLVGSPLMHWGLVALIASAAWGQLVRHEGVVLLFAGQPITDEAAAYTGTRSAGPLFADRYSRTEFTLAEARRTLEVDGVERGASPLVEARTPTGATARGWVYPNAPLRVNGLTVNRAETGPGVILWVAPTTPATESAGGAPGPDEAGAVRLPLRATADGGYRTEAELDSPETGPFALAVEQRPGSRIALSVDAEPPVELGVGESATVRGVTLRFDNPTTWATVIVVNDPSVPWLYASMWAVVAGALLSVLRPMRLSPTGPRALTPEAEADALE